MAEGAARLSPRQDHREGTRRGSVHRRGIHLTSGFECAPDVQPALLEFFEAQPRDRSFGNTRPARRTVERMATRQAPPGEFALSFRSRPSAPVVVPDCGTVWATSRPRGGTRC
ncbi:hypothetical protein ACWEJP_23215 [Streptomyces sp. NPDC004749]|uniref:hypothetical protein n=1 Tax=Streptomyces hebeiensis TaxID=229486 RepID=UPI003CD0728F